MRCPKCGYISFDYNKFCPKCNKDISDEQAKLNLHNYRHNAPSLLGMLVGAGDESSSGFTLDSTTARERAGAAIEDKSPAIEQGLDFSDDELEISLSDDTELELPEISMDDQSSDLDNLGLEDDEVLSIETDEEKIDPTADTGDDLSLDLGDLSMKGDRGFSTIELNVSDLKINDTGELEIDSLPGNEPRFEMPSIDEDDEMAFENNDSQAIDVNRTSHLELSDLTFDIDNERVARTEKANGTIKSARPSETDTDSAFDLGDLALDDDDMISEEDNEGLDLDGLIFEETDESESASASMAETLNISSLSDHGTGSLELGDLAISEEDAAIPQDDGSIDLSDLSFDDEDIKNTGENIFAGVMDLDNQETGELKFDSMDIKETENDSQNIDDSQALDLGSFNDSMSDLAIDLENLDLDLDFDAKDDKK